MALGQPEHLYYYVDGKSNKEWGYTYDPGSGVLVTYWRRAGAPSFQTNTKAATKDEVRKLVDSKTRKGYYLSGTSLPSRHYTATGEYGWTLAKHRLYHQLEYANHVEVEGIHTPGQREVIEEVGGFVTDDRDEAVHQADLINAHAEVADREYSERAVFDGRPVCIG